MFFDVLLSTLFAETGTRRPSATGAPFHRLQASDFGTTSNFSGWERVEDYSGYRQVNLENPVARTLQIAELRNRLRSSLRRTDPRLSTCSNCLL